MSVPVPLRLVPSAPERGRFAHHVARTHGELRAGELVTLQVNLGRKCNQACRHCHVDASPLRTEMMTDAVVEECLEVVARTPEIRCVDITGGAPEIHSRFREIVSRAYALERKLMVRHNLTVQLEPGQADLPEFFAAHGCEVVCSLPHYTEDATDRQRGHGVYEKSIAGLHRLNAVGYGQGGALVLTLVSNPVGAFLPPKQDDLERDTRAFLRQSHGIVFDRLHTITNMPIERFARWLDHAGLREEYARRLEAAFNPETIPGLMCRSLISVSWNGNLYDCDFNQMLELGLEDSCPQTIHNFDLRALAQRRIRTGEHCFGCTAGSGSSCGGAIA